MRSPPAFAAGVTTSGSFGRSGSSGGMSSVRSRRSRGRSSPSAWSWGSRWGSRRGGWPGSWSPSRSGCARRPRPSPLELLIVVLVACLAGAALAVACGRGRGPTAVGGRPASGIAERHFGHTVPMVKFRNTGGGLSDNLAGSSSHGGSRPRRGRRHRRRHRRRAAPGPRRRWRWRGRRHRHQRHVQPDQHRRVQRHRRPRRRAARGGDVGRARRHPGVLGERRWPRRRLPATRRSCCSRTP